MTTGNINITGNTSGGPDGARTFGPYEILAPTAVDETLLIALINGNTTVTVPTGTTGCVLTPPNAQYPQPNPQWSGDLVLKGTTSDSGINISDKWPIVLAWDADTIPTQIVLTSTAVGTATVWFL